MPRVWAMGCSASNAAVDLTEAAKAQAMAREAMILKIAEEQGISPEQAHEYVAGARRKLDVMRQTSSPNANEHGVAAPVVVNGETYQVADVEYRRGGDRVLTAVRPLGGGRFATRRIVQAVEGGEYTRVVSSARGG